MKSFFYFIFNLNKILYRFYYLTIKVQIFYFKNNSYCLNYLKLLILLVNFFQSFPSFFYSVQRQY